MNDEDEVEPHTEDPDFFVKDDDEPAAADIEELGLRALDRNGPDRLVGADDVQLVLVGPHGIQGSGELALGEIWAELLNDVAMFQDHRPVIGMSQPLDIVDDFVGTDVQFARDLDRGVLGQRRFEP